jgi:adenine phosphoribosyltransferase
LQIGFIPIRKAGKLPVAADRVAFVDYSKEEKGLELGQGMLKRGTRVLLADEWIETGTQVCAAIQLIEAQGGVVAGVCAINIDENERTRRLRSQYRCCAALR